MNSAIKSKQFNVKEYRRKIVEEAREYLQLRDHMQKFKKNSPIKLKK
jgi:hypothetical protein